MILLYSGVIVLSMFIASPMMAQNPSTIETATKTVDIKSATIPLPGKFIDKNNDGICDNRQVYSKGANCPDFSDRNKDGICDNLQKKKGNCCYSQYCKGPQHCCRQMKGNPNCCGKGPGYQHRHGWECVRYSSKDK